VPTFNCVVLYEDVYAPFERGMHTLYVVSLLENKLACMIKSMHITHSAVLVVYNIVVFY
jgi:hypothetical protein